MTTGLPVSRLISVAINLSPVAAPFQSFGTLLIVGDTDVIDVAERLRVYEDLDDIAADFGTSAPEYIAAALYFGQKPQPAQLYMGRWAQGATHGLLRGGSSPTTSMNAWQAVTSGAFKITVDGAGSPTAISSLNFSGASNLNGVASIINTALASASAGATCTWDGHRFLFKSSTTGASSSIGYLTAPASGTDIKTMLAGTQAGGAVQVAGIAAESAVTAVTILDGLQQSWYGLTFASTHIVDADRTAIAAYVEGAANAHLYGATSQDTACLDPASTSDIAYLFKAAGYARSFVQYSSSSAYAAASLLGRALTVDFNANNSTITLMYKVEPGVTAESLTSTQIAALEAKNCNVFVNYNNNTAIIEQGRVASGAYIDETQGLDWLANRIQTDVWNQLYTSTSKVPQTDAGMHLIANTIEAGCAAGVNNGLLAPGTWTTDGFGQLKNGDFLPKGYYVFTPPISSQADADRAARKTVSYKVAAKLAGAVHNAVIGVNVNR
jgi:hypothetical protein